MEAAFLDRARFLRKTARAVPPHRFVDAAGARLRIFEAGSGEVAFVVVPDPPNVLEHHRGALDRLAREMRVLGLELPGFGHSTPPPGFGFGIDENASVVLAALDALDVERAVLAFPCIAGLVALEVAARAPERVAGVVLAQTPSLDDARRWARRVDPGGVVGRPVLGQALVRIARRRLAATWYRAALPKGADTDPWERLALEAYDRGGDYCLASALQSLRRASPIAEVTPPVLAFWGELDRTHRGSDPDAAVAMATSSRVVRLDHVAHFPDLEAPSGTRAKSTRSSEGYDEVVRRRADQSAPLRGGRPRRERGGSARDALSLGLA